MNSCDLCFSSYDAAAHQPAMRWALMVHPDVRELLPTPHADTLRLLHRGERDGEQWAATLTAAGFPAPRVAEVGTSWGERRARAPAAS